jgi:hypothetical protein
MKLPLVSASSQIKKRGGELTIVAIECVLVKERTDVSLWIADEASANLSGGRSASRPR